jgi:signal transduction histidine kinase
VGRIVSDLLAFSRRSKPQRAKADLNKLIRTTVGLVGHKLKLTDSEAVLDLDPNLPAVECDASQIQQVILNLVLNAAEAMQHRGGGRLSVSTSVADGGESVELRVHDTGEGIAPENMTKIIDPIFTTKPEGKGVGLGLAVLYGIVKAHDGEVEVTSRPDQGTTFTVTLPVKSSPASGERGDRQEHAA